jgi:hypothetical protein
MDRLSSGTWPIIEYGGGRAICQYAMWIFSALQHAPAFGFRLSAFQHTAFGGLSALGVQQVAE